MTATAAPPQVTHDPRQDDGALGRGEASVGRAPDASGDVLIRCRSVARRYRSTNGALHEALRAFTLDICQGELLCLLGPSGCGKTTVLNLLAGFTGPTSGTITIGDRVIDGPSTDRGVVFQDYSLFAWLSVADNVAFGLRMAGVSKAKRRSRALELLAQVGMQDFADKFPFELSGGMKQRVAIARSLATNPQVLLMDEPFAALDAHTRAGLHRLLLDIQQSAPKTIVFVTHNIGEAIVLADRVAVMTAGPGRLDQVLAVDIPRPRARTSAAFNQLYEELEARVGTAAD